MENENTQVKKPSKKKKVIKYILTVVLMLVITGLALFYVLKEDPQATLAALVDSKVGFIILMIGLVLLAYIFEGLALTIFSKLYRKKYKLHQGIINGLIGSFFSAITPSSSGGQFVQAYVFSRQGVKSSSSASILVMLFIVSQIVIIFYGTLAMIFGYDSTIKCMDNMNLFGWEVSPIIFSVIGYTINILVLFGLIAISYSKKLHHFILTKGINLLAKMHIVKNPVKKRTEIAASVATFRIELTRLFKNIWLILLIFVIEFLKFTCMFSIPFFAGLALTVDNNSTYFTFDTFMRCLWSCSYLNMITGFIPIPGASGVAETGFQLLFSSIFGNMTSAANLLYRGVSFYFTLIVGGLTFAIYRGSPKKAYQSISELKNTFVNLRIVSLASSSTSQFPVLKEMEEGEEIKKQENDKIEKSKTNKKLKKKIPSIKNVVKFNDIDSTNIRKNAIGYLSNENIKESFEVVKKHFLTDDSEIEQEDSYINDKTKSYLTDVYKEMEDIEKNIKDNSVTDAEIQKAIKEDLDALASEDEAKRLKKEAKKLDRKNKKGDK